MVINLAESGTRKIILLNGFVANHLKHSYCCVKKVSKWFKVIRK